MRWTSFALLGLTVCLATFASIWWSDGNLPWGLLPIFLFACTYGIWKLPLRYPVLVITFLALTLENPSDVPAQGLWKSPLYTPGALLLSHLNLTLGHKALFFSGLDLCLVALFVTAFHRWLTRSTVDRVGGVRSARPMVAFCTLSLVGAVMMWLWGFARGEADIASSLWQMQRVVYLPLVFFLFHLALRGPKDRAALAGVFIAAACTKALLAIYVRFTVEPPPGSTTLQYATSHADSMLFAGGFCLVLALLFERYDLRRVKLALCVLPLLAAGMVANHRRVVWVEVIGAMIVLWCMTPRTRLKRAIARGAALVSPVALVYVVLGWSSQTGIFEPVGVIRSIVDSKADPSTMWRDWENYDIFYTFRQAPLFGSGYGHPYIEIVKLPDISQSYSLYRFIPHNGVLALWAYGGLAGFAALWTMLVVGLYFSVRSYRFAVAANDRVAALSATAAIVVYLVHCYGDMGLGTWTSVFTVAPAFAVASNLAVTTGAWPSKAVASPQRAQPAVASGSLDFPPPPLPEGATS